MALDVDVSIASARDATRGVRLEAQARRIADATGRDQYEDPRAAMKWAVAEIDRLRGRNT